jgi:hypothetical protein
MNKRSDIYGFVILWNGDSIVGIVSALHDGQPRNPGSIARRARGFSLFTMGFD